MGLGKSNTQDEPPEFGAAADGDADRNMILGKRWCCYFSSFFSFGSKFFISNLTLNHCLFLGFLSPPRILLP